VEKLRMKVDNGERIAKSGELARTVGQGGIRVNFYAEERAEIERTLETGTRLNPPLVFIIASSLRSSRKVSVRCT
jgi:hypothetical protein